MSGSELQTLGIVLIICGVICFVGIHFLLKRWKKRILRNLNSNQYTDYYGGDPYEMS